MNKVWFIAPFFESLKFGNKNIKVPCEQEMMFMDLSPFDMFVVSFARRNDISLAKSLEHPIVKKYQETIEKSIQEPQWESLNLTEYCRDIHEKMERQAAVEVLNEGLFNELDARYILRSLGDSNDQT